MKERKKERKKERRKERKEERKKERKEGRKKERKKSRLDSNGLAFIFAGVSNVDSYKRTARYNFCCLLQTYCHLSTKGKLSVS